VRPLGRPEGHADRLHTPQQSNAGDGREPLAGVRILKGRSAGQIVPSGAGSGIPAKASQTGSTPAPAMAGSTTPFAMPGMTGTTPLIGTLISTAFDIASSLRVPADIDTYLALAAMLGEKLPLTTQNALAVRQFVRRHGGDPAAARVAARALAAGLDPDGPEAERLFRMMDTGMGDGDLPGGSAGEADQSSPDTRQFGHDNCADSVLESTPDIESIGVALSKAVQLELEMRGAELIQGSYGDGSAAPGNGFIPSGNTGRWICVPLAIPVLDVDFHGFLRIWYDGGSGRASRVIADIRCGEERRLCSLVGTGSKAKITYHADSLPEREAFKTEFGPRWKVATLSMAEGDLSEFGEISRISTDA